MFAWGAALICIGIRADAVKRKSVVASRPCMYVIICGRECCMQGLVFCSRMGTRVFAGWVRWKLEDQPRGAAILRLSVSPVLDHVAPLPKYQLRGK